MGIENCDTMLMILAASLEMEKKAQHYCTHQMMKGFCGKVLRFTTSRKKGVAYIFLFFLKWLDLAAEAGTSVTGGQSVVR